MRGTGAALSEVNYLGTYTDENDRDVLRLEWKGDIGASATYLNKTSLAFKFDKDLYDKIDWERSFGASAQDKESKFQFQNVNKRDYQAELSLADMKNSYTGALYQLPVNLVLKEGVKLSDLGNRDFLIQHRAIEPTNKFVWTNVPGTLRDVDLNEIQYNQYTKSTVIPGNSNIKNDVIPSGVQNNDHVRLSYGTSEYDSAKKTLRVDLKYRKNDSTTYGGNFGLVQSFDARLLDLLEEDEQGNVAYVNVLDTGNDKAYKNVTPIGISREQINVKDGVATIYVVGQDFKSNIEDSGIKVVRTSRGNRTDGVESVIDGSVTINYVATSVEYKVNEDAISKLFPENKYLDSYAFNTGLIRDNADGIYRSDQKAERDVVIEDGGKLTLDFNNQNKPGRGFLLKIGNTEHRMQAVGPKRADDYETLQYRNTGGVLSSARDYVYDIVFQSGRTIKAGDDIRLWVLNGEDKELVEGGWRLFLNTGNPDTDTDVVKVDANEELTLDKNPFYLNNTRSVDGVMITKYKYVPQVEDIYDKGVETTENNSDLKGFEGITGTVRKEANDVTAYYILPDGSKYYVKFTQAAGPGKGRVIILDQDGKEVEEGSREYNDVYDYTVDQLADGEETLKIKKDMEIYINNSSEGQFPSDPVVEKVKARVIFDQNYEGKPADKVVEAPENEQALGTAGYQANGLDYNGTNVMPEDPTREGKTFVGWATTPDATEADFTKDTPITESIKVYAVWKDEEIADNYEPSYKDKTAKVGEPVTSKVSFTDKNGDPTTAPEATYTLGEGAPQGADVDADGNVTYTPVEGDANTTVTIPVVVSYTDGSSDTVDSKITVGDKDRTPTTLTGEPQTVKPDGTKQETGLKVENKDDETPTKVTATDEDGNDVPATIDEQGNIKVTPSENVDGPITVVVEDEDFPEGKITKEVPVEGHEAGRDDNGSDKTLAEDPTTVDNSNVKPVDPTDEEQGTGIIITNKDDDTTVTATDEDGKDIPTTIDPETGEVKVTPGTDVDGPIKVKVEDPDLDAPVETEVPVNGHEAGQDDNGSDKTTVDNSNVKPVDPTDEEQGTGIIITNKDDDTTVTATDEDGKDIPTTIDPETGEVKVTPGTDVDGPIKVKVEDPDLDAPVETDVPVNGHEAGQDDNGSDKTQADKITPDLPSEKTEVEDKDHLTDEEKDEVKNKIEEANKDNFPQPKDGQEETKVEVGDNGDTTITYPDGSKDTIPGTDLVVERDKTTIDDSNVKPVNPTNDEQETGIKVENPDKDTKVSAKDEDGKDIPVRIDENGNVVVTPGEDVDGPITIVIEDKDLPNGKVEITVPVEGHEAGRDDNGSDKTIADKVTPNTPAEKTEVEDRNNLTQDEKDKVKKAIEDANKDKFPEGTKVEIGNDGTATITYPDGSVDTIKGEDLVVEIAKAARKEESTKKTAQAKASTNKVQARKSDNVKTGVGSLGGVLGTLAAAVTGLFASKKKNKED